MLATFITFTPRKSKLLHNLKHLLYLSRLGGSKHFSWYAG